MIKVAERDVRRVIQAIESEIPAIKKKCIELETVLSDLVNRALMDDGNKVYKIKLPLIKAMLVQKETELENGKGELEDFIARYFQKRL